MVKAFEVPGTRWPMVDDATVCLILHAEEDNILHLPSLTPVITWAKVQRECEQELVSVLWRAWQELFNVALTECRR